VDTEAAFLRAAAQRGEVAVGAAGGGATVAGLSLPFAILHGDTNRDGTWDNSDFDGRHDWSLNSGGTFIANVDDDNGDDRSDALHVGDVPGTVTFQENGIVENDADALDIAWVRIPALGASYTPGMQVWIFLENESIASDAQSVHVYGWTEGTGAGMVSLLGGLGDRVSGGTRVYPWAEITPYVSATVDGWLGIEGMFFKNNMTAATAFDGTVDLFMGVWDQDIRLINYGTTRLGVAPWLMNSHTQASQEIWSYGGYAPSLYDAAAAPGYYGLDHSGQLFTTPLGDSGRWTQDHAEVGYTQIPGWAPQQSMFRLPYGRGPGGANPIWPVNQFVRPDAGIFQFGRTFGAGSGDYGGNIEVTPPTAAYPRGRILFGNIGSAAVNNFFNAQGAQPTIRIPTSWLIVGHVDEYLLYDQEGRQVVADPGAAYSVMEALPVADRGKSVYFATGANPVDGTVGAVSGNRVFTGIDHTVGPAWNYIRIYDGTGEGQVGLISARGNGYVDVSQVYRTGTKVIDPTGADSSMRWALSASAPVSGTWHTTAGYTAPAAGSKFVLVEGSRVWPGGTPAFMTVHEVLDDAPFRTLQNSYQNTINGAIAQINAGVGTTPPVVRLPTLFLGTQAGFATNRSGVAWNPGMANFHPLNNDLYISRQYGPRNSAGVDLFEQAARDVYGSRALFVEVWDYYHVNLGELHCGSVVMREAPATWW
jgi:hypothetical protein